jgi:hypothetical protein
MNPLLVLQAQAEVRALLYMSGKFDLEEALVPLLRYAVDSGIASDIGDEAAISIIRQAFKGIAGDASEINRYSGRDED